MPVRKFCIAWKFLKFQESDILNRKSCLPKREPYKSNSEKRSTSFTWFFGCFLVRLPCKSIEFYTTNVFTTKTLNFTKVHNFFGFNLSVEKLLIGTKYLKGVFRKLMILQGWSVQKDEKRFMIVLKYFFFHRKLRFCTFRKIQGISFGNAKMLLITILVA